MELFGIGPLELLFILVIALIILGPQDMVKAGKTLGRFMRKIVTSPEWRTVQKASRELKYLPNRLMREAALEDLTKDFEDINKIGKQLDKDVKQAGMDLSSWTTPPPAEKAEILPPIEAAPVLPDNHAATEPDETKTVETEDPKTTGTGSTS